MVDARCLVIALSLGVAAPAPVVAAALEPHRAAYRLSLGDWDAAAPMMEVNGVDGLLVIEWRRACDGWLARQWLGFVATTEEEQSFSHDVRFSSWESFDGDRLRFSVRSFEGAEVEEEFRGEGSADPGGVTAHFRQPEDRRVNLPGGTVFPTEHLELVLRGAAAGENLLSHKVFDGWGFDALTQITTAIGQPRPLDATAGRNGAGGRAWPVSMAYYNVEAQADVPEFEAAFLLDEKGVLRDLELDYGDLKLEANLLELESLEAPDC